METDGAAMKEALLHLLAEQRRLRETVRHLESRSKRNNIRVYRVPERLEGDLML